MCRDCFLQEPRDIVVGPAWDSFQLTLTTKIALGQLLKSVYSTDYLRGREDTVYAYLCAGCGQQWWVREPWYPYKSKWEQGWCLMARKRQSSWVRLFTGRKPAIDNESLV